MHLAISKFVIWTAGIFGWMAGPCLAWFRKCFGIRNRAPDEKNRIRLRANSLLVRAEGKTIVIETGNGTKWDAKQRAIYGVQAGDPLMDSLAENGAQPGEVDLVINTHLHFDHAGGKYAH